MAIKCGEMSYYKGFSVDSRNTGGTYYVRSFNPPTPLKSFDSIREVKAYINGLNKNRIMTSKNLIYVGKSNKGNRVVFKPSKNKSVKYTFYTVKNKSKKSGKEVHALKVVKSVLKGSALKGLFKGAKRVNLPKRK